MILIFIELYILAGRYYFKAKKIRLLHLIYDLKSYFQKYSIVFLFSNIKYDNSKQYQTLNIFDDKFSFINDSFNGAIQRFIKAKKKYKYCYIHTFYTDDFNIEIKYNDTDKVLCRLEKILEKKLSEKTINSI